MEEQDRSVRSLFIRYLIAHTQCSGCGRRYAPRDVHIYSNSGDLWLASVNCRHCGLQGFVMAAIASEESEAEDALRAERVHEHAEAFETLGPILGDEILDLHCFLQEFDGSMVELLTEADSA